MPYFLTIMERLEDLLINDLKIYQDDSLYCFTSDAVLLSRFARVKKGDVVADFCSGSGIVGLHLYALNPVVSSVTLFEMQKPLHDLAVKSVAYNNLQKVVFPVNVRLQDIGKEYNEKFSLIVCNPPYESCGSGEINKNDSIAICRSEQTLSLEELIACASKCLKFGGRFNLVHRADRLAEIIYQLKVKNIEPKRLQFVSSKQDKEPYLVMIEGVKGGKPKIQVLNNIVN